MSRRRKPTSGMKLSSTTRCSAVSPVAVAGVDELALVAGVPPLDAGRLRPCEVAHHAHVVVERQRGVGPEHAVGPRLLPRDRHRAVGEQGADGAAAEDVALDPHDREVGRLGGQPFGTCQPLLPGLDVQRPDVEIARLAGDAAAPDDRHHRPLLETDPARVEERRRIPAPERAAAPAAADLTQRTVAGARAAAAGEVEDAAPFQEELALLGEEQAEAGQVHLLLVRLDLREVGVPGEVGGEVLGQAVLDVEADIPIQFGRWVGVDDGRGSADGVRLDVEDVALVGQLQTHQHGGVGHPEDAPASHRDGHRREVDALVVPAHDAAKLDSPDRRRSRPVAERLERDLHLDGPAALEASRAHVPYRVPVAVRIAFVGDGEVAERTERIGIEGDAVAPIVERVEGHPERVVLAGAAACRAASRSRPTRSAAPSPRHGRRRRCSPH